MIKIMEKYAVKKVEKKKNICVEVPGSKSITNRALMLAAVSDGICRLQGVLFSDDSRAFLDCLFQLGFQMDIDESSRQVIIKGESGKIPNRTAVLHVGSAGTAARFITVFLAVAGGDYVVNASEQMKKRPMRELLEGLEKKGVQIKYLEKEGHFPFEIHSSGIPDTKIKIDTTTSSQYASALFMAAPINGMEISLTGERVNGAYINITLKMLEQFGISYEKHENCYRILPQHFQKNSYFIEPDMSAACYFYAMAILLKIKSVVRGIHSDCIQGDKKFLSVLEKMGCHVKEDKIGVEVDGSHLFSYHGLEVDMSDFSDQALTMAVVAAFADSPTRIKNIGHIRRQESDRVQVIVDELSKLGGHAKIITENGRTDIVISPSSLHGAEIDTHEDHRVAMSFALAGLLVDHVIIKNPMCCKKTE